MAILIRVYNFRTDHFTSAVILALVLHIALAVLLPDIPKLSLQGYDRASSLTVFLEKTDEQEIFDQSLNQQLPLPANTDTLADPALGSTSIEKGQSSIVSDELRPSAASGEQAQDAPRSGLSSEGEKTPSIRFDYATIKLFAKREAARYAELYPREVERFARTFNRARNYRRRSRTEGYRDKLGDLYARSNSSDGDICFKQKRVEAVDEYVTNTVYFFRCDSQPQGWKLDINNKIGSEG
ncbi:MAG: hypothetical protein JKX81_02705 [Arenicella sp.]|nr:hypothetical protein [Arenicella sp.]